MAPKKHEESPNKEIDSIKSGRGSSKKVKHESDIIKIILTILEVHNIPDDGRQNLINVSFMGDNLLGDGEPTFVECTCRSEADPHLSWTLSFKDLNEQTLMDISAQPLIVSISKIGASTARDLNLKFTVGAQSEIIAYCRVGMFDLICEEVKVIKSKAFAFPACLNESPLASTVPNMTYIKYSLTSSHPLIPKKEAEGISEGPYKLNTFTLTTEFIMHPTPEMFEDDNQFEVSIFLPLKEGSTKTISFKQGYRCKFCEMPRFKTFYGISDLPGDVKCSSELTNSELDFENLIITGDCYLPTHLVRNYSQMICLDEVYRCRQFNYIIKNLVQMESIPVEVVCKKGDRILRFEGCIDTKVFGYVDQALSRQAIPLKPIEAQSSSKTIGGKGKGAKTPKETTPASTQSEKTKAKGKRKGKTKEVKLKIDDLTSYKSNNSYAVCEDGYNTCLVIEIQLDQPIIPLKDQTVCLEEISIFSNGKVFNEVGVQMVDKRELNSIFKTEILKFFTHPNLKAYHKCREKEKYPMNDIWSIAENDLFGSSALLVANKFNFNRPLDDDEVEEALRISYIYLINKINDVLNDVKRKEVETEELIKFRLQCAEECRELGYTSAKHFHIMNLKDTCSSARCLIDYAVFNLRIGDEAKALECVLDASTKNPTLYDCYLLKAYVYYTKRDKKSYESTLEFLTKACPNFLEAWMALYVLYTDIGKNSDIEFIKQSMQNAAKFSYIGYIHKLESIFWPAEFSSNIFVISMSNFITWGCIQFAELTLAASIFTLGANSYEYIVHQALINYVHGRYIDTLHDLKKINPNSVCKMVKIKRLQANCLLSLKNNCVMTLFEVLIANFQENKVYTPRCNLINIKIARFFFESGRSKDARYYLKKCCKRSGTYASLIELGNVLLSCRSFEMAIKCFKLAHKMDPYDWFPWVNLAFLYFRMGLTEQYKICAENAKQNKITDEILSRELDKIDRTLNE